MEEKSKEQGELKQTELVKSKPKTIVIFAISLAPPGHFRAKHYFQSGEPTRAEVTEAQLKLIKADRRLTLIEGDVKNAVDEETVLRRIREANSENVILAQAERILRRRKAQESDGGTIRRKLEVGH